MTGSNLERVSKPQDLIKDSCWLHWEEAYKHTHCTASPPHLEAFCFVWCALMSCTDRQNVQKMQANIKSLPWKALVCFNWTPCCSDAAIWNRYLGFFSLRKSFLVILPHSARWETDHLQTVWGKICKDNNH